MDDLPIDIPITDIPDELEMKSSLRIKQAMSEILYSPEHRPVPGDVHSVIAQQYLTQSEGDDDDDDGEGSDMSSLDSNEQREIVRMKSERRRSLSETPGQSKSPGFHSKNASNLYRVESGTFWDAQRIDEEHNAMEAHFADLAQRVDPRDILSDDDAADDDDSEMSNDSVASHTVCFKLRHIPS